MRRPRHLLPVALTGLLAAGALAGCGSADAGPTVDAPSLAHQISTRLAAQYRIPAPVVHCPPGEANATGKTFACSTVIDGQSLAVNAEVAKPGTVNWQPAASVVSTRRTEEAIQSRYAAELGAFSASCGDHALQVVAVNASFSCTATIKGSARTFEVTAYNLTGDVELGLEPPATGSGSTTSPVTLAPTPGSTPKGTLPGD